MFLLHRPDDNELHRFLDAAEDTEPTYEEIGATRDGMLFGPYTETFDSITLGASPSAFPRAVEGLRTWKAHAGVGAIVVPDTEVKGGATHIVMMRIFPFWVPAPVRVVYVIDEPGRFGWAYGTLPGHPEQGEELFLVRTTGDDTTTFEIRAFSRPVELLARAAAPLTRAVQQVVTRGYLRGLKRYVDEAGP